MKPINFKRSNTIFAKDQTQYIPLPAYRDPGPDGTIISCWKLTLKERIKILFTGKLWLSLLMFGKPLTPQRPSVNKWDTFDKTKYYEMLKEQQINTL